MVDVPFTEYADVNPHRPLRRGHTYPFVEMAAVPEGGGDIAYVRDREFEGAGSRFAVGDTLFARITPCTENGKVASVSELGEGGFGHGSTELIVLAAKGGRAEPRFVYQVAASDRVRRLAVARMLGTSGRQRVPMWFFTEGLMLPEFSLPEQRAIAAVLDAIDDAIERTEAVIAATERLRGSLLHELLTRGVPGWHSEWKQVPGLGTVPACWDVVRLGELCAAPEYGAAAPARPVDPDLPRYVRITDLTDDGRLRDDDPRSADPSLVAGYELIPGDLLFARSGATVGKTYLYRAADGPCVFAGYLIRFRPIPEAVRPEFLELWTHSNFYARWVASMFRAGAQPNINAAEYSSLPVPRPQLPEQDRIVAAGESFRYQLSIEHSMRQRLAALKIAAADALLTGRVRIPVGAGVGA